MDILMKGGRRKMNKNKTVNKAKLNQKFIRDAALNENRPSKQSIG